MSTFTVSESPPPLDGEPMDETPPTEIPGVHTPYDPRYPDSTPEAPFGYKPDGTPYKRHHSSHGAKTSVTSPGRSPATAKQAETAAAVLGKLNGLFALALYANGFTQTSAEMQKNNADFVNMATEALSTDPVLCKKILSAGATGGKAGLVMAYGVLGASIAPAMVQEIKEKKKARENDESD